ncbi:MAG TPA: FkbM family methyltransferase [Candidatus Paceibacterota bacterium]|nr:FkbM family methyltransferase [Candidatus Paceibacterota bacterium]
MKKLKSILFFFLNKLAGLLVKTGIHRRIPVLVSFYDFFYQMFWPHKDIIEIQGSRMYINIREKDPSMRRTFQTYAGRKIHEEATTNLFKKNVRKGDIVVDLGANLGYFTLLAAQLVGERGKVFSFEPEPKNYNYLVKNIELNGYKNVSAFQKAISDRNGKTQLFICSYDTGHHTINSYEGIAAYSRGRSAEKKSIEIETLTLDDFLKNKSNRVDIAKIDVEGAEFLAIKGMKNILEKSRDIKIFLEFFPLLLKQMGSSPEELIKLLIEEHKFNIFAVGHDYAMTESKNELVKINNFKEIMGLLKEEDDHINLYLKR